MFCAKCGAVIAENAVKCDQCGAPVRIRPVQASKSAGKIPDPKAEQPLKSGRSSKASKSDHSSKSSRSSGTAKKGRKPVHNAEEANMPSREAVEKSLQEDSFMDPVFFEEAGGNVDVEAIKRIARGEIPDDGDLNEDDRPTAVISSREQDMEAYLETLSLIEKARRFFSESHHRRQEAADERNMKKHIERAEKHFAEEEAERKKAEEARAEAIRRSQEEKARAQKEEARRAEAARLQEEKARAQKEEAARAEAALQQEEKARAQKEKAARAEAARQQEERARAQKEEAARVEAARQQEERARAQKEEARRAEAARQQEERARAQKEEAARAEAALQQEEKARAQKEEAELTETVRLQKEEAELTETVRLQKEKTASEEPAVKPAADRFEGAIRREEQERAERIEAAARQREMAGKDVLRRENNHGGAEIIRLQGRERPGVIRVQDSDRNETVRLQEEQARAARAEAERAEAARLQEQALAQKAEAGHQKELIIQGQKTSAGSMFRHDAGPEQRQAELAGRERRLEQMRRQRRYRENKPDRIDVFLGRYGLTKEVGVRIATLFLIAILSIIYVMGRGSGPSASTDPSYAGEGMTGGGSSIEQDAGTSPVDGSEETEVPTGGGDFQSN